MFTQLMKIAYHNHKANTEVDHTTLDRLLAYVLGKLPMYNTSWIDARAIYMVLCVRENHWIAVKINLEEYEFILFNCNLGANLDSFTNLLWNHYN